MMAAAPASTGLIARLPKVRGTYEPMAELGRMTWFRAGGPAEVLFTPADAADLQAFMKGRPNDVPFTVIGLGSNMLVRDGGVPGVVVKLGRAFAVIETDGLHVRCGAGAVDANVAIAAKDAGIAGLEFLTGIPGTIGGALRMNGGAYGREIKDVFVSATAVNRKGDVHKVGALEMGFAYRHTEIAEDWIFLGAELKGEAGVPDEIAARIRAIRGEREDSQPTQARTGGSTFANPPGKKAWELVDAAGGRGLARGGAQISEKHTNFLINTGNATAADLEDLGEDIRRRVQSQSGVTLHWEVRRIGVRADDPRALRRPS